MSELIIVPIDLNRLFKVKIDILKYKARAALI